MVAVISPSAGISIWKVPTWQPRAIWAIPTSLAKVATENVMRPLPIVSTLFSHSEPKQLARKSSCWFQRNRVPTSPPTSTVPRETPCAMRSPAISSLSLVFCVGFRPNEERRSRFHAPAVGVIPGVVSRINAATTFAPELTGASCFCALQSAIRNLKIEL